MNDVPNYLKKALGYSAGIIIIAPVFIIAIWAAISDWMTEARNSHYYPNSSDIKYVEFMHDDLSLIIPDKPDSRFGLKRYLGKPIDGDSERVLYVPLFKTERGYAVGELKAYKTPLAGKFRRNNTIEWDRRVDNDQSIYRYGVVFCANKPYCYKLYLTTEYYLFKERTKIEDEIFFKIINSIKVMDGNQWVSPEIIENKKLFKEK